MEEYLIILFIRHFPQLTNFPQLSIHPFHKISLLKIAYSPLFKHPLPEGHRFPMDKYELIPQQLLYEGCIETENLYEPSCMEEEIILLTHTKAYWTQLKTGNLTPKEIRKTGFPFSPQLLQRGRVIAQGTLDNVAFARKYGVAFNGAGGTHHAFADHGEGFCILNDIAIAANYLLHEELADKILVVDLDVHQGNGTAAIFRNEPRVFTFSMHCEANYPLKKETSNFDIGLAVGTTGTLYLDTLKQVLPSLIKQENPALIFYLSGVDVLATDKLGKLSLSKEDCKARDQVVLELCKECNIPVVVSLGGGYSQNIRDIVDAHCNTFRLAKDIWF